MAKKKRLPKEVSPKPKEVSPKPKEKRDRLINILRARLLSNRQLERGNAGIAIKHSREIAESQGILDEINEIGKKLGMKRIGLHSIRR